MEIKKGQTFCAKTNVNIFESKGVINYEIKKGDIGEVDRIIEHSAFPVRLKIGETLIDLA